MKKHKLIKRHCFNLFKTIETSAVADNKNLSASMKIAKQMNGAVKNIGRATVEHLAYKYRGMDYEE